MASEMEIDSRQLIDELNKRCIEAWTYVYEHFYGALVLYVRRLGYDDDPEDIVQGIFVNVWERKQLKFETYDHLKNYLYLSVRNALKNDSIHRQHDMKYRQRFAEEESSVSEAIEVEIVSQIDVMLQMLPEEMARVLRLYIEGLDTAEIASLTHKAASTIYNQRNAAIKFLKKYFNEDCLSMLLYLMGL